MNTYIHIDIYINKEIKIINRSQKEILDLKSTRVPYQKI